MGRAVNCSSGTQSVSVNSDTKELVAVRAKLAEVYSDLVVVLERVDARDEDESTTSLKNAMLGADRELMHYISMLIDVHMMESNYMQL